MISFVHTTERLKHFGSEKYYRQTYPINALRTEAILFHIINTMAKERWQWNTIVARTSFVSE